MTNGEKIIPMIALQCHSVIIANFLVSKIQQFFKGSCTTLETYYS